MVHRREGWQAMKKFLRTHVQGQAAVICKNFSILTDSFEKAWDALVVYYENKRRLVNAYLTDFMAVKPIKTESSSLLNKLYFQTFTPLDALLKIGISDDLLWSDIVVHITTNRFDEKTLEAWYRLLGSSTDLPTIEILKKFINGQ